MKQSTHRHIPTTQTHNKFESCATFNRINDFDSKHRMTFIFRKFQQIDKKEKSIQLTLNRAAFIEPPASQASLHVFVANVCVCVCVHLPHCSMCLHNEHVQMNWQLVTFNHNSTNNMAAASTQKSGTDKLDQFDTLLHIVGHNNNEMCNKVSNWNEYEVIHKGMIELVSNHVPL